MKDGHQMQCRYRADLIRAAMASPKPKLTNEDVAEKAGLSAFTVSAIRNGHPDVRLSSLVKVADALGLDMQQLFAPIPAETEGVESAAA
jgi:transcriptional regulator with XRE-family HTH domain